MKSVTGNLKAELKGQCRYCGLPVWSPHESITYSYWQGLPFYCHASCKVSGEKQESLECQTVDADCNDCRHYRRGKIAALQVSRYFDNRKKRMVEVRHQPDVFVGGHCLKFNRPTLAQPKKWSGLECFEHRRSPAGCQ